MTVTIIDWDGDDRMSPLRLMGDHAAAQETVWRCDAELAGPHEQIAFALRHAENDATVDEVRPKLGVAKTTFYRWKRQFVGMGVPKIR